MREFFAQGWIQVAFGILWAVSNYGLVQPLLTPQEELDATQPFYSKSAISSIRLGKRIWFWAISLVLLMLSVLSHLEM